MAIAKKIIVTGATGFIGSHLVRALVNDGHHVVGALRRGANTGRIQDVLSQIEVVEADILDAKAVQRLFQTVHPDGVFHLAASNIMSGKTASDDEVIAVNFLGTKNLMDAAAGENVGFFVNTGTFLEYGLKDRPVAENDRCEPTELYSVTKLAATTYGQVTARRNNIPVVTFRLFTPYGPAIQKGRLVRVLVENALRGDIIKLSSPKVSRDFVFVEDVVALYTEVIEKAVTLQGEVFNVGSGVSVSFEDLVAHVLTVTDSKSKIDWGAFPLSPYDSVMWQADMRKTHAAFSWRPRVALEEGLRETAEWLKRDLNLSDTV